MGQDAGEDEDEDADKEDVDEEDADEKDADKDNNMLQLLLLLLPQSDQVQEMLLAKLPTRV